MAVTSDSEALVSLNGHQKAAALMLSLTPEYVSKVFAALDDDEIRELSMQMASLGRVRAEVVENLYIEFAENVSSTGALVGSFENTERLLKQVLDNDRVKNIMEELRGPAGRTIWDKICNVNEEVLASFLKNEYPQTIAVIMTKIRPNHAAKVMTQLPRPLIMEVMQRMLSMEVVQREVIEDIEATLRSEFMTNLAKTSQRDSHEVMAEIFNAFDRATETSFMEALEKVNADAAAKIKSLMFTFEDLIKLDNTGIQTMIRVVDKSRLALALKGTSEPLKTLFFSNMSERASKLLKEDMEALGMVRLRDVEESQSEIVGKAKELIDKGEIALSEGDEEEQLIG